MLGAAEPETYRFSLRIVLGLEGSAVSVQTLLGTHQASQRI